jgi:hypothetical protein
MANRRVILTKYTGVFGINQEDVAYGGAILAGFALDKLDRLLVAHATDKRKLVFQGGRLIPLRIGSDWYFCDADVEIDASANLDTGVLAAGRDYCVYACSQAGSLVFRTSLNTTYPDGFTAATSRKLGGFHTLCVSAGVIAGHPLSGYVAGDVLPHSIWDLKHRARCGNNAGMAWDPMSGLWVDIYLASGTGVNTASVNGGTISDTRDWNRFVDDGGAIGKRLLDDSEFQLASEGSNMQTNIAGSADPVTTTGHTDTAGRRMISNIGLEDCCGALYQWLRDQSYQWGSDGTMAAAAKTLTAYYAAAPGGNPIYVKYANGRPYLAANMATDTADKWLTFGNAVTIQIKHDADAATGGYQVFVNEAATQPGRLLCALPGLKTEYLDTSDPNYPLRITYNAAPGTPGVAIHFDDGADQRLEFISPTAANATLDLASYSQSWGWQALTDAKGQLYKQGPYGDVKLLAGGSWTSGTACGPRDRYATYSRWHTSSYLGARFRSEPL